MAVTLLLFMYLFGNASKRLESGWFLQGKRDRATKKFSIFYFQVVYWKVNEQNLNTNTNKNYLFLPLTNNHLLQWEEMLQRPAPSLRKLPSNIFLLMKF